MGEPQRLRVMVDANILVAGLGWPRFPHEVLQHAVKSDYILVLSPYIIAEARKHFTRLFPKAIKTLDTFLEVSNYEAVPSPSREAVTANASLMRDPKDVPVALSAIQAKVDFLVTQDRDFTDRNETTEELHKQLQIILPGTFLRVHMSWTSEQLEAVRKRTWEDLSDDE